LPSLYPDVPPFTYDPAKYVSGAPVFAATDETYDEVDVKVIGFQWAMPFAGSKMSISWYLPPLSRRRYLQAEGIA
jgi:hypothetical protein